jgi:hypothetical protein
MRLAQSEIKEVRARGPHDPEAPARALAKEIGVA